MAKHLILKVMTRQDCSVSACASLTVQRFCWVQPAAQIMTVSVYVQPPPGHVIADWNIIQACGIFAMSVSGHSSLPVLRNSMARPQVRPPALCCQ